MIWAYINININIYIYIYIYVCVCVCMRVNYLLKPPSVLNGNHIHTSSKTK